MALSHSPSASTSKKNIFQKIFGKVRSAVMALGVLSAPVMVQANSTSPTTKIPPIEERLAFAEKMNLESIKSINELQKTIEFTWSQLRDTPKAPKEIRDKYGHITSGGLDWIESELPKEYHRLAQKYRNIEKELEKIDKKDPKWGTWEYSLISLGVLLVGLIGYKFGKVSKKELEDMQNQSKKAQEESRELRRKIAELEQQKKTGWKNGKIVDAKIVEPAGSSTATTEPSIQEIPEWTKGTFLAEDSYTEIRNHLATELTSESPSSEALDFQKSIEELGISTGTDQEKAGRLSEMSEKFISYARYKSMPEETITELMRALEGSFRGKEFSFKKTPIVGDVFDSYEMERIGEITALHLRVTKVLSMIVEHEHRVGKKAKVNC